MLLRCSALDEFRDLPLTDIREFVVSQSGQQFWLSQSRADLVKVLVDSHNLGY